MGVLHSDRMTWKHHRIWIIAVLALTGAALIWMVVRTPVPEPIPEDGMVETPSDLTGRAIYTSGEYGFAVFYPETAQLIENALPSTYRIQDQWRVNAIAEGDPIVTIVAYSTESDHSYPRYYHALVRVGASADPDELAACEHATPDRGEVELPDTAFGGATWKVFSFGDAGMQQYVRGVSYRTVHEDRCIAVEKIAIGSSYREDPASADDIADEVLMSRYEGLDQIIESFTFAR